MRQENISLGIASLSAYLKKHGHQTFLVDYTWGGTVNTTISAIKRIKPDNVQIYSTARIPAEYFVYSIDDIRKQEIVKYIKEVIDDKNVQVKFY